MILRSPKTGTRWIDWQSQIFADLSMQPESPILIQCSEEDCEWCRSCRTASFTSTIQLEWPPKMDSFRSSKFLVRWYPKLEPCPNKAAGESFWPNQFTPRHIMSLTNISHAILQVDSWPDSKQVLFATFFCVHLEMSINGLLFLSQSFPWYASLVVATSTRNKRVELWVSAGPATMFPPRLWLQVLWKLAPKCCTT